MWRAREKELELEAKLKSKARDKDVRHGDKSSHIRLSNSRHGEKSGRSSSVPSSSKRGTEDHASYCSDEGGLRDDEVEEFLRARLAGISYFICLDA